MNIFKQLYLIVLVTIVLVALVDVIKQTDSTVEPTTDETTKSHTRYCEQVLDGVYVYVDSTGKHYCDTDSGYLLLGEN